MQRLQVEPLLALLGDDRQVGPKCCFGNGFCISVIALLSLDERRHADRGNVPRFKAHLAERAADEIIAQTGLQRTWEACITCLRFCSGNFETGIDCHVPKSPGWAANDHKHLE